MNPTDQIPSAMATMMARIPVATRLGIMVMAGSPPRIRKASEPFQDSMTGDAGRTGPCRISPTPCSMPARAASTPTVDTEILVALEALRFHLVSGSRRRSGAARCVIIAWDIAHLLPAEPARPDPGPGGS